MGVNRLCGIVCGSSMDLVNLNCLWYGNIPLWEYMYMVWPYGNTVMGVQRWGGEEERRRGGEEERMEV